MIHLDASTLIDLMREEGRERPGAAFEALEGLDDREALGVSVHVVCELRAGAELSKRAVRQHEVLDELLSNLIVSYPDQRFGPTYARLLAALQRTGKLIGAMDLLIATAAIIDDASLMTRNVKDFARVPGLRLIEY